jgi:two-component system KDP operon response regulator KdpE
MSVRRARTLFIVDDDPGLRTFLRHALGYLYVVRVFENGQEALDALQSLAPDVLLTDLQIPDVRGEALAGEAALLTSSPRIVVMSGDRERLAAAAEWAHATVPRPFALAALCEALEGEDHAPSWPHRSGATSARGRSPRWYAARP